MLIFFIMYINYCNSVPGIQYNIGNARCWGDGQFGSLGSGDEKDTGNGSGVVSGFVDLGGTTPVVAIGEGPCAIFESGDMKVCNNTLVVRYIGDIYGC